MANEKYSGFLVLAAAIEYSDSSAMRHGSGLGTKAELDNFTAKMQSIADKIDAAAEELKNEQTSELNATVYEELKQLQGQVVALGAEIKLTEQAVRNLPAEVKLKLEAEKKQAEDYALRLQEARDESYRPE